MDSLARGDDMGKGREIEASRPGLGLGSEGPCEVWVVERELINASGQEGLSQRVLRCSGVRCFDFILSTVVLI